MKKLLSVVLAFSLCGLMFTACNKEDVSSGEETTSVSEAVEDVEVTTGTTTAETEKETEAVTEKETEAVTEKETEAVTEKETEAVTEQETEAVTEKKTEAVTEKKTATVAGSYASLINFVQSGDAFRIKTEAEDVKDSFTYTFLKEFEDADGIYLDAEMIDGSGRIVMCLAEDVISLNMHEYASDIKMTIILKDSLLYMLDDETKTGYYMANDEETMEDYNFTSILGEIDFDAELGNIGSIEATMVEIGGKEYILELFDANAAFLFERNGKVALMLANAASTDASAFKINEFSGKAVKSMLEIPSDYEIIDLEAALSQYMQ